jgi:hypothetical protein
MADIKIIADIEATLFLLEDLKAKLEAAKTNTKAITVTKWKGDAAEKFEDAKTLALLYHDDVIFLIDSLRQHVGVLIVDTEEFDSISVRMRKLEAEI